MKIKYYRYVFLLVILVVIFLKNNSKYNIYQEDYIYVYDKVKREYAFRDLEQKRRIESKREDIIDKLKDCKDENEFVGIINRDFLSILNSPHTKVCGRKESFDTIELYSEVYKKNKMDKKLEYILSDNKVRSAYKEYPQKNKLYINDNVNSFDIIDSKIKYMKISSFSHYNIDYDRDEIKRIIKGVREYPVLIIDIRDNAGGDSQYPLGLLLPLLVSENKCFDFTLLRRKPNKSDGYKKIDKVIRKNIESSFIGSTSILDMYTYFRDAKYVVERNEDSIDYKGQIYLLINEKVCSSAGIFAAFMKYTKQAILVGTNTDTEILGTDADLLILPQTKLVLRIEDQLPIIKGKGVDASRVVEPDIYVDSKVKIKKKLKLEYMIKDKLIEKIISIESRDK